MHPKEYRMKLQSIARHVKDMHHTDIYYAHPCRSFADTDEALRIRSSMSSKGEVLTEITYKGPKIDSTTKTRIETSLSSVKLAEAKLLLQHLGFKEVAVVEKKREYYEMDDIILTIDTVNGLGTFTELEMLVATEEVESGRQRLVSLLDRLGLSIDNSIRKSYLELLLEASS